MNYKISLAPGGIQKSFTKDDLWAIVAMLIVGMHLLLPIGNVLPPFHLGPIPIHLPMVVYPLIFILSGSRSINTVFFRKLSFILFLFWATELPSILWGPGGRAGIYQVFFDFFTILFSYWVAYWVNTMIPRKTLPYVFIVFFSFAAIVSILERINSTPVWPYSKWYSSYWFKIGSVTSPGDMLEIFRVWGTMGNPIVFASLMMLGLPWASRVQNIYLKWVYILLLLVAATLTLSRTLFFFLVLYALYCVFRLTRSGLKNKKIILVAVAVAVFLICISDVFTTLWETRYALESVNPSGGIAVRELLIEKALHQFVFEGNPLIWALGNGLGSGGILAQSVLSFLDTIDNMFIGILYQQGVLGLFLYALFWLLSLHRVSKVRGSAWYFWALAAFLLSGLSFESLHFVSLNFVVYSMLIYSGSVDGFDSVHFGSSSVETSRPIRVES